MFYVFQLLMFECLKLAFSPSESLCAVDDELAVVVAAAIEGRHLHLATCVLEDVTGARVLVVVGSCAYTGIHTPRVTRQFVDALQRCETLGQLNGIEKNRTLKHNHVNQITNVFKIKSGESR